MEIAQTGFILYTIHYEKCIHFYENILGLAILYKKETLTCFDFHGSYLMVEIDDRTDQKESTIPDRDRTCIRINVENVRAACQMLDKHAIEYVYGEYEWGAVAKFRDPDGNLIGFRSAVEHRQDILNHS